MKGAELITDYFANILNMIKYAFFSIDFSELDSLLDDFFFITSLLIVFIKKWVQSP